MKDDTLLDKVFGKFLEALDPEMAQKRVTPFGEEMLALLQEEQGWEQFLTTLGKRTFTGKFSKFHAEFWNWYWRVTSLRAANTSLSKETLTFLAGWNRGGGKSSNIEWACITEGAMGLEGYVLYVCETQASANSHVAEIRQRLESEAVAQGFPHLSNPLIGRHSNQYGWKQDFLMTEGGWAIRPVGLDVAVRGLRVGDIRPTMIVFDDIDSYKASAAVRSDNLATIARSIIPTGTKDTIKLIAQNLISEDSIVNQIYTGRTDVLSDHIASVYPAFEKLEIDTKIDETGRTRHEIISCEPTWEAIDLEACQRFLNDSGLEAFYAEYQHDFSLDRQTLVIPEYSDYPLHVISWSQFEEKFGTKNHVPPHWQVGMGLDIGYTDSHLSSWTWVAVSAEDSPLPNARFRYRGMTFTGSSIDTQAAEVMRVITKTNPSGVKEAEQIVSAKMSHEKLGERILLNNNYGFNFTECHFGKEDGVPQWRNLLRVDRNQPHPFHPDEKEPTTGLYKLGRPNYFDVVDDSQLVAPVDDKGLAIQRAQLRSWKRRKVKLSNSGMQDAIPMKFEDDTIDSTRMIFASNSLASTPLTLLQRVERNLRSDLQKPELELKLGQEDYPEVLVARVMALNEARKKEQQKMDAITASVARVVGNAPQVSRRFQRSKRRKVAW